MTLYDYMTICLSTLEITEDHLSPVKIPRRACHGNLQFLQRIESDLMVSDSHGQMLQLHSLHSVHQALKNTPVSSSRNAHEESLFQKV